MMLRQAASHYRRAPWRALLALGLGMATHLPAHAAAPEIAWVDWYATTPNTVLGRLSLGDEPIDVTFSGDYFHAFLDAFPEPYWGPDATYKSSYVANAPPRRDAIVIAGGPDTLKLTFSQALADPVMAIASLGLQNESSTVRLVSIMDFKQPLEVLSNGPNFYAGGIYSRFQAIGNILTGAESSGTIRFPGNFETIEWKSTEREETDGVLVGTYIFTVGVNCAEYRIGPTPLASAAAVPAGCSAYNERSFEQQAQLDVRGKLDNRMGSWVQGAALHVAEGGELTNGGFFTVGELQTLAVDGTLRNFGLMDVRGTLLIRAGESFNAGGTLTLKGDNTLPDGGNLQIDAGASFLSTGRMVLESPSRVRVGGVLDSLAAFEIGGDAVVEVLANGTLALSGPTTVEGGILNRGLVRVANGGELVFDRFVEFGGQPELLDNRNTVHVEVGGRLRVTGEQSESIIAMRTNMQNARGGTILVDGTLQLDGVLTNAGLVRLGGEGEMIAAGVGSFAQIASGVLENFGRVRADPGGHLLLGGNSTVYGVLQSVNGGTIEVPVGGNLAVVDGGQLANEGTFINRGRVMLGGTEMHDSSGRIENHGVLRIGPEATLVVRAEDGIENAGRLVVDGQLFFAGGGMFQHSSGVLVNNGVVTHTDTLLIFGGRITGNGTFQASRVQLTPGEFEFSNAPDVSPGQSPGTLTFTGDLVLDPLATVTMEFTENAGADRLVVGGRLEGRGATMKLVFLGDGAPGLDQIFDFLEVPGGLPADLNVEAPSGMRLDTFARGVSAGGRPVFGVAFAPPGATRLLAEDIGDQHFNAFGVARYVEDEIVKQGSAISNAGTIGIRPLANSGLDVGTFHNFEGASLLNSARFAAHTLFVNEGVVKNRAGATFVNGEQLDNRATGHFENRGTLHSEGAARIVNRGTFVVVGELKDHTEASPTFVDPTILNDGGRFEVLGSVSGHGTYRQLGAAAVTRVEGVLQADSITIAQGLLTGSGHVDGPLSVSAGGRIEPGNSPGTLTVESLYLDGGEILIEIAAPDVYDRIVVTGGVTLDGLVRFRLLAGYVPTAGTSFSWLQIVNGGLYLGTSAQWVVEAIDPQGALYSLADAGGLHDPLGVLPTHTQVAFTGTDLAFTAAPVPEPGTWAMLLAGLCGVGLAVRRQARRGGRVAVV